jgi:DNA-damage-inducible protein J
MAQISIRIDDTLKQEAEKLFEELGMNMSTAVNVFIRQTIQQRRIPFAIAVDPEPEHNENDKDDPFYSEENMRWIRESIQHAKEGKIIVKAMEELEQMADG